MDLSNDSRSALITTGQDNTIDLTRILRDSTHCQLRLRGFFQRVEYLYPYLERIRHWLDIKGVSPFLKPCRDNVIFNIRRGVDFGALGWTIDSSYYRRALARIRNIGKVYLFGSGLGDEVADVFKEYGVVIVGGSPLEQFAFMRSFNRMVLSNSTFAWWAALLSNAE
jgi:hypothetical protein